MMLRPLALLVFAAALVAPRVASACTVNAECGPGVCDPATHVCVGCIDASRCSGPAPVCDPVAKFCASCNADFGGPGTLKCPSATKPVCQTSGAASGQCVECSATNASACAANVVHPKCDVARGACGCTADSDCRTGLYCDTNVAVSGACYFGCRVVAGADRCGAGSYCDKRDGTIGNCAAEPCLANADCGAGFICDTNTTPHACSPQPVADSGAAVDAGASADASASADAALDAAVDAAPVANGGGYGGHGCACSTARARSSDGSNVLATWGALAALVAVRARRKR